MQKKLFLSYIVVILAAVGISAAAFWSMGYSFINDKSKEQYLMQARMLGDQLMEREAYEEVDYESFVSESSRKYTIRVTLISRNGEVVADSEQEEPLDNHGTREEVMKALGGEETSTVRYSKTMKQEYAYSAVPIKIGGEAGVLRISLPLSYLRTLDTGLNRSLMLSLLGSVVVALVLAAVFMRLIAEPIRDVAEAAEKISDGDYNIRIYTREKAELGRLANSFNIMATNLRSGIEKLTRRKMELEAILRSMKSGVAAVDEANAILFCNHAFEAMFEHKSKSYVGKSLYNVMRNAVTFEAMDAVRKSGESEMREGYLIGGESSDPKMLRVTATPLLQEDGKRRGILLLLEDITQVKKLETIRTDFVSNVTHELKTPLTSIRGFIDTLKSGALEDKKMAVKFLDIIDIEAERLYSLIQDILILSEIEQKRDYEAGLCEMDVCIRGVTELLEHKFDEKVQFICEVDPYVRPYRCNPDRMKQLFINLLDNAIKYTEQGTIKVTCKEEAEQLHISVEDTGIGMEQSDLPRIFERFYRVDRSRSRKQGGTGLGLSIVKHIAELYGGTIKVDSVVGKGSIFQIWLPY